MKRLTPQQLNILALCGSWGYLSTRDVAKLAWPNNQAHSAHVMAQSTLSKLASGKEKYLLARDLRTPPNSEAAHRDTPPPKSGVAKGYVLTKRGAEVLNEHFEMDWCDYETPEALGPMTWFADGYNLSLKDHHVRQPVIELCHQMLVATSDTVVDDDGQKLVTTLRPIGPRGAARNYLGLHHVSHFDGVLVDAEGKFVVGIYLANRLTSVDTKEIARLAAGDHAFLIAADRPKRLASLVKWRAETRPGMEEYLQGLLPTGLEA